MSRHISSPSSPSDESERKANSVDGLKRCESVTLPNPYFPVAPYNAALRKTISLCAEMPKYPTPTLEQLAQLTQSAQFARLASQSMGFSPLGLNPLLQLPRLMTHFQPSPLLGLYGFGAQSLAESTALYLKSRDAISQLSEHKSK